MANLILAGYSIQPSRLFRYDTVFLDGDKKRAYNQYICICFLFVLNFNGYRRTR
jgi:hypothetical protein